MNRKKILINLVIVVLLIAGLVTGIFAVRQMTSYLSRAQVGLGEPKNVQSRVVGSDQAVISWSTDDEVISLILYGTSPTSVDETQTELSSVKTHRVTLNNLTTDTTYYFKIQVGQEVFDNEDQMWKFNTPPAETPPKLSEDEFKKAFGTADLRFDLNNDGVVNWFDYQLYLQQK